MYHFEVAVKLAQEFKLAQPSAAPQPYRVGDGPPHPGQGRGKHGLVVRENGLAQGRQPESTPALQGGEQHIFYVAMWNQPGPFGVSHWESGIAVSPRPTVGEVPPA